MVPSFSLSPHSDSPSGVTIQKDSAGARRKMSKGEKVKRSRGETARCAGIFTLSPLLPFSPAKRHCNALSHVLHQRRLHLWILWMCADFAAVFGAATEF